MPFKSKRQLQTCFGREISAKTKGKPLNWDCKKWLAETECPENLPTKVGQPSIAKKCRKIRNGESIISPVYEGPKGGHYFIAGGVKVYVPKGPQLVTAKKLYGSRTNKK
jgi:hypothetical protein